MTRFFIWLAGAAGLGLVARLALTYRSDDPVALGSPGGRPVAVHEEGEIEVLHQVRQQLLAVV